MAITAFKRYEQKFMLKQSQFDALLPKLLKYMEPDKNCKNGKEYTIYNIYYDTYNNDIIQHSLSKPYYKEKLRLRSYSIPTSFDDEVFLELKRKIGGIVNKRRAVMTLKDAYDLIEYGKHPTSSNFMNEQVVKEIEYFLSCNDVKPTTFISYNRMAFFGKDDKDFRVTFDCNITTRRDDLYLEKGIYGSQLLDEGNHLMEVKISSAVPIWLASILSELEIYKTSFSKYGTEYKQYCLNNKSDKIFITSGLKYSIIVPIQKFCVNY